MSDRRHRTLARVHAAAGTGSGWVGFASDVTDAVCTEVAFDRCCWHTVDPGTVLFTGSVNRGIGCSGTWLAEHEYVVEDVNTWWFLARSGRLAGATSIATHGDLQRSARHRSQEAHGIGDELRVAFVVDGAYWGAAAFLRDDDRPWFTEADVDVVRRLSEPVAEGLRRSVVTSPPAGDEVEVVDAALGPAIIVFDDRGRAELVSPAADRLVAQLVEEPAPATAADSRIVRSVAARVRAAGRGADPLRSAARARARTRSGSWLVVYGTPLAGDVDGRVAVVVQPASGSEVAPLVAQAYGLTEREREVVQHCMEGRSTKAMAAVLHLSPWTVQDHLKSIFDKTGVRSRSELVGQVFLEHYCPRWEETEDRPDGWTAAVTP